MRQRCILFLICVVSMWDCKGAYADSDAFARYVRMRDGQECWAKDDREAASGAATSSPTTREIRAPYESE
jgi:hypothetical protein